MEEGKVVARLQSGDPSIYGALHEQLRRLKGLGVPCTIVPGVTRQARLPRGLQFELTVPELSQTVIMTRRPAGRHRFRMGRRCLSWRVPGSLVIFLSVGQIERVVEISSPALQSCHAGRRTTSRSWPDEIRRRGRWRISPCGSLEALEPQALIIVGEVLARTRRRSARAL